MVTVYIDKSSSHAVGNVNLRRTLQKFLADKGIKSEADVSVAIVSKIKMQELASKYLQEKNTPPHNVLSFTSAEVSQEFVSPPDGVLHLGEIAICYDVAFEEAKKLGVSVETRVVDLAVHGAHHLLGEHHS